MGPRGHYFADLSGSFLRPSKGPDDRPLVTRWAYLISRRQEEADQPP